VDRIELSATHFSPLERENFLPRLFAGVLLLSFPILDRACPQHESEECHSHDCDAADAADDDVSERTREADRRERDLREM